MNDLILGRTTPTGTGKRKKARQPMDFYETPRWATETLLDVVGIKPTCFCRRGDPVTVYEICSGEDSITKVLRERCFVVNTNDLDPKRPSETHFDATNVAAYYRAPTWTEGWDWIITNPPYYDGTIAMIREADRWARSGRAFLCRLTFLEPTGNNGPYLAENPPDLVIVMKRISFDGSGQTDNVPAAWLVWYGEHAADEWPRGVRVIWHPKNLLEGQTQLEGNS